MRLGLLLLFLCISFGKIIHTERIPGLTFDSTIVYSSTGTIDLNVPLPDYDTLLWTEMNSLDTTVLLDMKYAAGDNFVETQLYPCPRCFFRPEVALALKKINATLHKKGLGLKFFDCYRPLSIQKILWQKIPDPRYVADPKRGSMHNRGQAADLTIVDNGGRELDMGTPFDFFGKEAYHNYLNLPKNVLENRRLLRHLMEINGFKATSTEWWHYSYATKYFPIANMHWGCKSPNMQWFKTF